jgi:hypothetical protein
MAVPRRERRDGECQNGKGGERDFHWGIMEIAILACVGKGVNVEWAYAIGPVCRHKYKEN